uniref:7TM_GPCR_Srx domain-containing protein n=1 Tax=Strongyloides papillosus TaxID=174720 RepID=A0A0N5C496_STREA
MLFGCCYSDSYSSLSNVFIITIFDIFINSTCTGYFVKLYFYDKSNHIAALLAMIFSLCLTFSIISNILNFIGIVKKRSVLMIPKLVLSVTIISLVFLYGLSIGYLRFTNSILFITFLENQTNVELFIGKNKIKIGEIILFSCTLLFFIIQLYFYKIMYKCYKRILEHEVRLDVITKIFMLMPNT